MKGLNDKLTYLDCIDKSKCFRDMDSILEFLRMEIDRRLLEISIEIQSDFRNMLLKKI